MPSVQARTALTVTAAGAIVENASFSGMDRAISLEAAGVTIRNSTFSGGQVAIQDGFAGKDTTLRGNTIDAVGVDGQLIDLDDGGVLEGNAITAEVVDPSTDNDTPLVVLNEFGGGMRGISITGNRIETDGGGLWIRLNGSNVPNVDIEANELYFTNAAGAEGLELDGPNLTGGATSGAVRIRNNVIDGIVDAEIGSSGGVFGIEVDQADALSSLAFINNSIRAVDAGATAGDAPVVFDALADGTFSGPLGVDFVNNLLVGPGSSADAVRLPSGTSFDADFNYFSGFNSAYAGGATTTGGNDQAGPADLVAACTDGDDTTACRLEVQPSAGAVDAGTGSGYADIPGDDIDATARPINVTDIGAHEQ
ncbi:MAG: right-handed parallel beta-helix repeat-containing protein [Halofilum sp. (in: g-proteobacteria)]|nr:right-handed parallel beta-helix repeat-containing protein [Halofilum sp. (in: g-proteobacteria)]